MTVAHRGWMGRPVAAPLLLLLPAVLPFPTAPTVVSGRHPNGILEVRLLAPFQPADPQQLCCLERTFASSRDASAIILITSGADARANTPTPPPPMEEHDLRRLASRERALHAFLREAASRIPVISVGDGWHHSASATGLFMAAPTRVCTDRTVLSLPECRGGLLPASGTLAYFRRCLLPHLHMYVALTGAPLNPHDCFSLRLATSYVRAADVVWLLDELRHAPAEYLDLALSRRARTPHESLASLCAGDVQGLLDASLLKVFSVDSASEVVSALQAERGQLSDMLSSCGWHTRERAEAVADVLDTAASALRRAPSEAIAETFAAVQKSQDSRLSDDAAWELELQAQCRLASRRPTGK
ncbi:hypothetical protein AB1Y20_011088 [Prymnesium parvum]|uniref:3-hydroxyisobutyryl-CoA hydrolase n=1 Tax=Prymnesium parvum TaxID=97485 RepID=A0AB34INH3_PRYPA